MAEPPLIVLDDDPTGAQSEAAVPVVLEWDPDLLAAVAAERPPAVHLLTNTRATGPGEARSITAAAAAAASAAFPGSPIFLRGDSTLRAHMLPEYEGVREALHPDSEPVLMLIPALPAAGRVTEGGIHYIEREGRRTPLAETEYARDPEFAYSSARLLTWAEERSGGRIPAARGRELHLGRLREAGPEAVVEALAELDEEGAAALAVDAVDGGDLALIAAGLRLALADGAEVIVRCAPAFVGVYSGAAAEERVDPPTAGPVLVLCGSHVPTSNRQLDVLLARRPDSVVWMRPEVLVGSDSGVEVAKAIDAASSRLASGGLAVVATERERYVNGDPVRAGAAIASGMAAVLAALRNEVGVVISKGGITSAVNVREGLAARIARVRGPLRDGVSLWIVDTPEQQAVPIVVFPGNVGGADELAEIVEQIGVRA
jgi:uncharacterized protein YgbK (DUF1537 family)